MIGSCGHGVTMNVSRSSVFMQAARFIASVFEFLLYLVSFLSTHETDDTGFYVLVLLSGVALGLSNEIETFESGAIVRRAGDPPRLFSVTRVSMASLAILLVLSLGLLAFLGVDKGFIAGHWNWICAALSVLVIPSLGIEFNQLRWQLGNLRPLDNEEMNENGQKRCYSFEDACEGIPVNIEGTKRNRAAYERIWEQSIERMIRQMEGKYAGLTHTETAKEDIWNAYVAFNTHASNHYMKYSGARLDRHKVCACYIYAILAARPFLVSPKEIGLGCGSTLTFADERLAMHVGCTLLGNGLRRTLRKVDGLGEEEKREAIERLRKTGILFPKQVGHGDYVESVLMSLHHTREEGNYNILQLALIIFHWERCTLSRDVHSAVMRFYRELGNASGH